MGQLHYNTATTGSVTIDDTTVFNLTAYRSADGSYAYSGDAEITFSNEGSCTKQKDESGWPYTVTVTPTGTFYSKTRILTIKWTVQSKSVTLDVYAGKNGTDYDISIDTKDSEFTACGDIEFEYSMTGDGTALTTANNLAVNAYIYNSAGSQVANGSASAGKNKVTLNIAGFATGTYTLRIELKDDSSTFVTKTLTITANTWTASGLI